MLRFFRNIRQKLIEQENIRKYFFYAIGEIFLVVIGILIALQINNWNEQRIQENISMEYLIGIKEDLKKDLDQLDALIIEKSEIFSIVQSIDSVLNKFISNEPGKYDELFIEPDTSDIIRLFYRGKSFRSFRGNYNALVSGGKTNFIKNRELLNQIQEIYDERHQRLSSNYEGIKQREHHVITQYPFEKRDWTYTDLKKAKNQKIFLDLANVTEMKFLYTRDLIELREEIYATIQLIKLELN
ncbi:MAG: DUF6090 family protein [Balneola sp.]